VGVPSMKKRGDLKGDRCAAVKTDVGPCETTKD
jgi:hypothetical protein